MLPTTASSSSRRHSRKKKLTSKTARMPRGQRVSSYWKAPGAICNLHPWELLPGAGTKQTQGAETRQEVRKAGGWVCRQGPAPAGLCRANVSCATASSPACFCCCARHKVQRGQQVLGCQWQAGTVTPSHGPKCFVPMARGWIC